MVLLREDRARRWNVCIVYFCRRGPFDGDFCGLGVNSGERAVWRDCIESDDGTAEGTGLDGEQRDESSVLTV